MNNPLYKEYLFKIGEAYQSGKATELTYRSALENLMEGLQKGIVASSDPKHISCGAPESRSLKRGNVPLGYVETKDLGVDLNKIEKSDQMKRYLPALRNLILTDYLEFRWYVDGEHKLTTRLASIGKKGNLEPVLNGIENITQLFTSFYVAEVPTIQTPKELAQRLAAVTHFIRDQIVAAMESPEPELKRSLAEQYKAFVDLLLPTLNLRSLLISTPRRSPMVYSRLN